MYHGLIFRIYLTYDSELVPVIGAHVQGLFLVLLSRYN